MKKAAVALVLLVFLSSCSYGEHFRARELNNLEPIETLCVALEGETVVIYACAAVRDEDNTPLMFKMEGESVEEAVEKLKDLPEGRDALFVHTKNLVFAENYCRERLSELKSFLSDAEDVRGSASVFAAHDVKELLDAIEEGDGDISADLEFLADHTLKGKVTRAKGVIEDGKIQSVGAHNGSIIPLAVEKFQ